MSTRPMTKVEARRIRQAAHHAARREDFARRLGPWGVLLAWIEEARSVAKTREKQGDTRPLVELAQLLEAFCNRYKQ